MRAAELEPFNVCVTSSIFQRNIFQAISESYYTVKIFGSPFGIVYLFPKTLGRCNLNF